MKKTEFVKTFIIIIISIFSVFVGIAAGFMIWLLSQHNFLFTGISIGLFTIICLFIVAKLFERWM